MNHVLNIVELVAMLLFVMGSFFFAVGSIGIIRFPDVFTRLHAAAKISIAAAASLFFGLILMGIPPGMTIKILVILAFIFLTNPLGAQAIGRSAHKCGVREHLVVDHYNEINDASELPQRKYSGRRGSEDD